MTHRNLAVPKTVVKRQSNKERPFDVYCLFGLGQLYAYQRGLRRCSFRQLSNARASMRGTSNKVVSHALFLCVGGRNHRKCQAWRDGLENTSKLML